MSVWHAADPRVKCFVARLPSAVKGIARWGVISGICGHANCGHHALWTRKPSSADAPTCTRCPDMPLRVKITHAHALPSHSATRAYTYTGLVVRLCLQCQPRGGRRCLGRRRGRRRRCHGRWRALLHGHADASLGLWRRGHGRVRRRRVRRRCCIGRREGRRGRHGSGGHEGGEVGGGGVGERGVHLCRGRRQGRQRRGGLVAALLERPQAHAAVVAA